MELTLNRTKGAPDVATLNLPALTSLCLTVEANAASGRIALDNEVLMGPSDFKNKPEVRRFELTALSGKRAALSVRLAGKPGDDFIRIKAFYRSGDLTSGAVPKSADEAIILGQAYIQQHSEAPLFDGWKGARAVRATPLSTRDGGVQAFEVDIESSTGAEAGYVVLESDELRPLLGSAATDGPSLTEALSTKYESLYGEPPAGGATTAFLWAGTGIMALEATLEDQSKRLVDTCDGCGATFQKQARPPVNFGDLGISPVDWIAQRRKSIQVMIESISGSSVGQTQQPFVCSGDGYVTGSYCPSIDNNKPLTAEVPGGRNAFNYYYQQRRNDWPSADPNAPKTCYAGCTPIAALTVLDYWDRRGYDYLIPDENGAGNSTVTDPDVLATIKKLRVVLKTSCVKNDNKDDPENNQGSTIPSNMNKLKDFIDASAKDYAKLNETVDLGWQVSTVNCPNPKWRFSVIKEEIVRGRPAVLHYQSNWMNGPQCIDNVTDFTPERHSAVVYGYWDDGDDGRFDDLLAVRTGWTGIPWRLEPTVGTGETFITSIRPGCTPGPANEPPLCKTFSDVPESHWGHAAAESLSCMCVMKGYPDGSFGVSRDVTKAEYVKIALKLAFRWMDLDEERRPVPAIGVAEEHWASAYIDEAYRRGMLDKLLASDGSFSPDEPITREEAAYLLVRAGSSSDEPRFQELYSSYQCLTGVESSPYADVDAGTDPKFYREILAVTNRCVFKGYVQDNTFKPANPISRIEAAKAACMARFGSDSTRCSDSPETCVPRFPACN